MALVVEDGTGLLVAEAYLSVADADAFHAARQNFNWPTGSDAGSVAMKEGALRRATDYLLQMYRLRWKGTRLRYTQTLDWPRVGVLLTDIYAFVNDAGFYGNVASNIVPTEVQQACALLALRAVQFNDDGSQVDLAPDVERVTSMEKVGTLEVQYEKGGLPYTRFRAIDHLLDAYLVGGSGGISISRA